MFRSRLMLLAAVVGLSITFPAMAADVPQPWASISDVTGFGVKGGRDHWEITRRVTTKLSASELSAAIRLAYEKAYARQGPGRPCSFKVTALSPASNALEYYDGDRHHWTGALTIEAPTSAHSHTYTVRFVTRRTNTRRSDRCMMEPCLPTQYSAQDR